MGGAWSIVVKFVASHCELHYVSFLLLGSDVAYYTVVCDISVLGNLLLADEEACVCSLDISDSLD